MAGRRVSCIINKQAVAVAMAVALLALLFAAGEAKVCNVDVGTVMTQCKSCSDAPPSHECCEALRSADFNCLCGKYWESLKKDKSYAKCAAEIPSTCKLPKAKCH